MIQLPTSVSFSMIQFGQGDDLGIPFLPTQPYFYEENFSLL